MKTILGLLTRLITERPKEDDNIEAYFNFFLLLLGNMVLWLILATLVAEVIKLISE